ncbi:MAG: hypothetical protein E7269_07190 [Lachnospiraceae bacterium]|nr:hypothetical protein [Lachnospiraceae bacterium]
MIEKINLVIQMVLWAYIAWKDLKTKEISLKYCIFLAVIGCVTAIYSKTSVLELLSGASIGILFLVVAYLSGERIGYGDGMCITAMGLWQGGTRLVFILCLTMLAIVIVGGALLVLKKVTKKSRLPMMPFVYGALCVLVISG